MRAVVWIDNRGAKHRSLIKDTDGDEMAVYGIPADPPDLDELDWDEIRKQIKEVLFQQEVWDYSALQASQVGLQAAGNIVKRHIQALYIEYQKRMAAAQQPLINNRR